VDTERKPTSGFQLANIETALGTTSSNKDEPAIHAGDYLSSLYAQKHHDWKNANSFIGNLLMTGIDDPAIRKRAMILAMGSGDVASAVSLAKEVMKEQQASNQPLIEENTVALVFMIMDTFDRGDHNETARLVKKMPKDGMSSFIGPLLEGWSDAAQGEINISRLKDNAVHLYHAILISDYLGKHEEIEILLQQAEQAKDIPTADLERIADIYAHINKPEKALNLYKKVKEKWPNDLKINEKIELAKKNKKSPLFKKIDNPKHGLAEAFLEISKILFDEYSDESARVFGHMALYLNPNMTEAKLLLAHITGRHERYEEAVRYYRSIPKNSAQYIDSQLKIADIFEMEEKNQDALNILYDLAKEKGNLDAMIKIGDLYRRQEKFGMAIDAYNMAIRQMGGEIPEQYWHLHYVLGMAHERANNWTIAEKELKSALAYRPEHPYIMNYLGYAWADRNMNLKLALEMIRKASNLRPSDGYITDSLGWVLYKMGEYQKAVPELEKAVELLPYDPVINNHLGDAYWRVGRKLEARFQWTRAKNHSTEEKLLREIEQKLANGLNSPSSLAVINERKLNP